MGLSRLFKDTYFTEELIKVLSLINSNAFVLVYPKQTWHAQTNMLVKPYTSRRKHADLNL